MKSFKTYVTEKNKPTNPKLWAASIAAAKSKFDVYPSAYANAWASKHYKSKGGGYECRERHLTAVYLLSLIITIAIFFLFFFFFNRRRHGEIPTSAFPVSVLIMKTIMLALFTKRVGGRRCRLRWSRQLGGNRSKHY